MAKKPSDPIPFPRSPMPEPPAPPADLGASGARLWREIMTEWAVDGAAERAVLAAAARSADIADSLRARIEAASPLVKVSTLITAELAARSLMVRLLTKLGVLDADEKKRGPGRPPRVGGAW